MDPTTAPPTIWQGSARAGWGLWGLLGLVGVLCAVLVGSDGGPVVAGLAPLVLVGLIAVWFSSMRVDVTRDRVEVRSGVLGWPRSRMPLATIASVRAEDVRPMRWGGWGYRGSRRFFKRAAWIVRSGPGLILELTDGSTLTVTVDDAAAGAASIRGLQAGA